LLEKKESSFGAQLFVELLIFPSLPPSLPPSLSPSFPPSLLSSYLFPLNPSTSEAGLVGMQVGGKRRVLVRPERGWFKGKVRKE